MTCSTPYKGQRPWDDGERGPRPLPLPEALALVAQQRREQVADDAAGPGLDLDRHGHAGGEVHGAVLDRHAGAVQGDARGVDQLLAGRLARMLADAVGLV